MNFEKCMICNQKSFYFFSKTYSKEHPGNSFNNFFEVAYYKCENCGFVHSKTHQDLSFNDWNNLNNKFHHHYENLPSNIVPTHQPPYINQSLAIKILVQNNLINIENSIDYAAGYGTLSRNLFKYFNFRINLFDKYINNSRDNINYIPESNLGNYDLVINSAMFEHVIDRSSLDYVNNLVSNEGVFMLHTVVCENVPKDPNWFYLEPIVHTAFHTNKSMSILMKQWGYTASIYAPQAKSWFLFKEKNPKIASLSDILQRINLEMQTTYFYYKDGFVDYWKGF